MIFRAGVDAHSFRHPWPENATLVLVCGDQIIRMVEVDEDRIDLLLEGPTSGIPTVWSFKDKKIRMWPVPDADYHVFFDFTGYIP